MNPHEYLVVDVFFVFVVVFQKKKKYIYIYNESTKVQTLGTIWLKCSNIWIENIFACIG